LRTGALDVGEPERGLTKAHARINDVSLHLQSRHFRSPANPLALAVCAALYSRGHYTLLSRDTLKSICFAVVARPHRSSNADSAPYAVR
jgi:hypothetical protein